jgi:Tfp pilus assembly protein PilP
MKAILRVRVAALAVTLFTSVSANAAVDIPRDLLKERDPFKMPPIVRGEGPKSELESFPAADFKLIGVLSGGKDLRAMIASPNGRTYFVRPGMVMGVRKGKIRKITETAIYVREKIVNVLGDEEDVDTVLNLPNETKQDVRTITSEHGW